MKRRLEPHSDEEEAAIQRGIAQDPDNPEWTEEDFREARPAIEMVPEIVEAWRRSRGKQKAPTKVLVSLRLQKEIVDRLRETGPGWQTRANEMLRKAVLGS